jgi:hypothetical protein
MSNAMALMATTASFAFMLQKKVREERGFDSVSVETLPPDASQLGDGGSVPKLNLFLYQVTPNAALENADLPFRDAAGTLVAQPGLALNLHYLLTAYAAPDRSPAAHHVLGQAMSVIHDNGVIPRAQIRDALTAFDKLPSLRFSDLADAFEPIKLTALSLSTEDLFRLWSAFGAKYRISVAYEASVAVVERSRATASAPPVRTPNVQAVTMRRPVIESVSPDPALAGQTLTIKGRNLYAGGGTFVRFPSGDVPVTPPAASDRRIQVGLPSALSAGPNYVQVVHQLQLGPPGDQSTHRGVESDPAPFALAPLILEGPPPAGTPTLPNQIARGALFTVGVTPKVRPNQRTRLMLGPHALPRYKEPPPPPQNPNQPSPLPVEPDPLPAVRFRIPPPPTEEFPPKPIDAIPPGTYKLRLSVDGVESPLVRPDMPAWTPPDIEVT